MDNNLILDYLRIFVTLPFVLFVLGIIFTLKFQAAIDYFLRNLKKIKAAGVELTQESTDDIDKKLEDSLEQKGIVFSEEQISELENEFEKLASESVEKEKKIKDKDELINFLVQRSETFEFLYLNLLFVPHTKFVLNWMNQIGSFTKELYEMNFQNITIDKFQRETIFNVLLQTEMIQKTNGLFVTTDKTARFLLFSATNK